MLGQNWTGIMLLVIASICGIAFVPQMRKAAMELGLEKKFGGLVQTVESKYFKYVITLIMLIGAAVRLWKFGIIPAGFNQDGAMGAVDALALAHHGTDRFGMWMPVHFTAWGFGQMSVLLSYITVPFIWMFGLNRFTARVAMVIVSLIALWVLYSLCKMVFGRKAAVAVLAFCAINPWQIIQSRWALDCNLLPHFFLFSVYFLCLGLKNNKKYLYLSMVFFGLTMYTYGIAWYTVPLFLAVACLYFLIKKRMTFKEVALSAGVYLLVAWPILAVMIINLFKLQTISTPFFTIPFFPDTQRTGDLLFFSQEFSKQLISNFQSIMDVVILQKPDAPWNTIPDYGSLYLFSSPLALVGLVGLVQMIREFKQKNKKQVVNKASVPFPKTKNSKPVPKNQKNKKPADISKPAVEDPTYLYMPVFIWLIISLVSGLIINGVNVNRINIIFYPMIILSGIGIYMLVNRVKLLGVAIVLVFALAFGGFSSSYFGNHSKEIADAFYDGFGESLEYVKNMDYDRVYVTNWTQSEGSWWVSEPLTLFHHQVDALYYQGKAEAVSKSGKKLLPYSERYKYVEFKNLTINPEESAAYVVHNEELGFFDKEKFDIVNFAKYNAVIPKK